MDFSVTLVALAAILMPVGIIAIIFGYANTSEKRFHDTAQRLIENGQTLDEEVLSGIPGYQKKGPRDDIRGGIITAGTGLGITLLGYVAIGDVVFGAGLLVLCIGLTLFGYGYLTKDQSSDSTS